MISPLVFSHILHKLFSSLNIFPTLQPFSNIRNLKQLKGFSNEDAAVKGKLSILIGSMADECLKFEAILGDQSDQRTCI